MTDGQIIALIVLGALVLASAPIVVVIKFWMDMGVQKATAENASTMALAARNQAEILRSDMASFKERVTMEILPGIIASHETRMANMFDGLRRDMGDMRKDLREIHQRIDKAIERRD